jgi:hypothetical protein
MKYIFAVLLVLLVAIPLGAQQYVIEWTNTIDNGGYDAAYGIAVDVSGNVYVTGRSNIGGDSDYLTVKYGTSGNILRADTLDNGSSDAAYGIAVDDIGNVYVTGDSWIGGNSDYLTVKYDSLGSIVWEATLDNGSSDYARGIAVDVSGNVYVTGRSNIGGNSDYLTVKYDSLGNIVWADTLDTGSDDYAFGIAVDVSGNVYVTGGSNIGGNSDYLTVKYDSLGNIVWVDTLDNGDEDEAFGIAVDGSGNAYITGYSNIGGDDDYLTVKYDSLGNIVWADTLDTGSYDYAFGIAVDVSGNVYVTGRSDIGGDDDYLTVKYDSLGSIVWEATLDNGSSDYARGIAVDGSGNVYVTGRSNIGGDDDYLTVKYAKYKDAGILSIVSPPDTVSIDTTYIPGILVRNNSYENTVDIDVVAFIDSAGIHIYSDLQSVYNLTSGDSTTVSFTQWDTPSNLMDLTLRFFIITPDMNPENDSISKTLYVRDLIPPVIDSAVAFDGVNALPGIDDDDYVILYFSEPTNKPTIDNTNINSALSLSGGHSWLDGTGIVGICGWNLNGDQLTINLTTNTSLPTIAVGDTITPDGVTITDVNGNFCSSPVVLGGSFDPTGIADRNLINKTFLNVYTINKDKISFSYGIKKLAPYKITLYTIDGRMIKSIEGEENGYHEEQFSGLPSGIYFLRLSQGNDIIGRKAVLIR